MFLSLVAELGNFHHPFTSMRDGICGVQVLLTGSWRPLLDPGGHLCSGRYSQAGKSQRNLTMLCERADLRTAYDGAGLFHSS